MRIKYFFAACLLVLLAVAAGYAFLSPPARAPQQTAVTAPTTPYGVIKSIQGQTLVLQMDTSLSPAPFIYTVTLATSSTITLHINKDPKAFAAEQKAYQPEPGSTPPIAYDSRPVPFSFLTVGMIVEAPGALKAGDSWVGSELVIDSAATSTPSSTVQMAL